MGSSVKVTYRPGVVALWDSRVLQGKIHDSVVSKPVSDVVLEIGAGGGEWADVLAAFVPSRKPLQARFCYKASTTAKHFPRLGAALHDVGTDTGLVTPEHSPDEIRSVNEALLSNKWVQGELRGRLGLAGVTLTDAMGAGSLKGFGGADETAKQAAAAGMDLLL
ncbi:hypothetical protein PWT90_10482 [Aphanocladium album]|nr:hypothetical protein PWT90_10482 [Aphanocladium album]